MKKNWTVFLFLLFVIPVSSQTVIDTSTEQKVRPPVRHELSMETTTFFKQFFSGDSVDFKSPYFLTYKYIRGNRAVRFGIGGQYDRSDKSNEEFADSRLDLSQKLNLRLGYEWRPRLGGKWIGYLGIDLVGEFGQDKTIRDSGIDVITNKINTRGVGVGPAIGIQFQLTEKLSLSTEGFFYYMYINEKSFQIFQNFPQFDDVIEVDDRQELRINLPSTIYINYTF